MQSGNWVRCPGRWWERSPCSLAVWVPCHVPEEHRTSAEGPRGSAAQGPARVPRAPSPASSSPEGVHSLRVAGEQHHAPERGRVGGGGGGGGRRPHTCVTTHVAAQLQVFLSAIHFKRFEVSYQSFDVFGVPLETSLSCYACRKHRAGVDIHSCSQFLLELYSRWILPSGSARRTPIILISEVVRSVSLPSPAPLPCTELVTVHTRAGVFTRTPVYGHCTLTQSV